MRKFLGGYFRQGKVAVKMLYGLRNLTNLESVVYCFTDIYGISNLSENLFLSPMPKIINGPAAGY
jgi:hypothetical protein